MTVSDDELYEMFGDESDAAAMRLETFFTAAEFTIKGDDGFNLPWTWRKIADKHFELHPLIWEAFTIRNDWMGFQTWEEHVEWLRSNGVLVVRGIDV